MSLRALLLAAFLGAGFVVAAEAHEYKAGTVTVSHPWARATPPGAKVGAAYFAAEASKAGGDTLIGAKSDVAGRVELHTHIEERGVVKMRQIEKIEVAAGKSLIFQPSGLHLMLMDLKAPLKEGDILPITLVFEKAGEIKMEATIEKIGARGPHGMDHHPNAPAGSAKKGHHHH